MNPSLGKLHPYPFEKLKSLFAGHQPNQDLSHISLSIGEPKSPTPEFIKQAIQDNLTSLAKYPLTKGEPELREAFADWTVQRFSLPTNAIDSEQHVLPVNGTREALFAIAQTCIDSCDNAKVILPNPFYQIYEGAALLAGAEPVYIDFSVVNGEVPALKNIDDKTWKHVQLVYICSPSNPTGEVLPIKTLQKLIDLAHKYDFIIASDECYSEIYFNEQSPPQGILRAAWENGDTNFKKCLAFYSLSKRSNAPGLRSGFVVGDLSIIEQFLKYRTYHGCAMSISTQLASAAAWKDEQHVKSNRTRYRSSFDLAVSEISKVQAIEHPQAAFYLWLPTPIDDEEFALGLYCQQHITVLPGKYLGRKVNNRNPGTNRVRIALVASPKECQQAAERISHFLSSIQ